MLTKSRLILISLFISSALIACGDNSDSTIIPVDTGTSEKATLEKLGTPTVTQSRTIDALTFTQSEWTNESGTTSVQFQNGTVTFSQFTPAASQD